MAAGIQKSRGQCSAPAVKQFELCPAAVGEIATLNPEGTVCDGR